ncbi:MAG: caspase family protein [Planctomycetaceae bacterium]|nr:caspase family protein [Planctomycetaceae bacterium]
MRSNRRRFLRGVGLAALGAASVATKPAFAQGATARAKPRGIAMTVGLNRLDPDHYPGALPLRGCINDSIAIFELCRLQKFTCYKPLLNENATAASVLEGIRNAARELKAGDLFLIQYSGHGGQVPDRNGDEADGLDETWCLYDRMLIDDELGRLWTEFADGVRILMISDSCHSGSVARGRGFIEAVKAGGAIARGPDDRQAILDELKDEAVSFRYLPEDVLLKAYQKDKSIYDKIADELGESARDDEGIKASVLLLSGCQDNQLSADLSKNGLFTARLLETWNEGHFRGNYRSFHSQIVSRMPATQTPNFYPIGVPDLRFWLQKPFTI